MNILLLGGGGREHAFAWKISRSKLCDRLFIAPGNAGTSHCGINLAIDPCDFAAVREVVTDEEIGMVVVGPEEPLVRGIYDFFQADPDLRQVQLVGPSADGARLEGSKAFAKKFMEEFGIPTARYREFTSANLEEGLAYIGTQETPIVLKADGLAAGKGVLICQSAEEARREFQAMLGGKFGEAGSRVVIEQFLDGIEFSVFVLTDGENYRILPIAKDYKRVGEGDTGLNTGGMGSVSPVPFVDEALLEKVESRIIRPTIRGLQSRRITYQGFIFFGLILVGGDPYVIEYNCRMGDPETQVVLPRLRNDLVEMMLALGEGTLADIEVEVDPRTATAVILVAGGYPGPYEKGKIISGIDDVDDSMVFHAGTKLQGGEVVTNGGRVFAVTSLSDNLREAINLCNQNAEEINFEGKYYRRDIGFDL